MMITGLQNALPSCVEQEQLSPDQDIKLRLELSSSFVPTRAAGTWLDAARQQLAGQREDAQAAAAGEGWGDGKLSPSRDGETGYDVPWRAGIKSWRQRRD